MAQTEIKDIQRGPFKIARNEQAYMKCGMWGDPGSGKTHTASLIAKGLYERTGKKAPVYFIDSEAGSDWVEPMFKEWGIPLYSTKTRAFVDLIDGAKQAEKDKAILIIDSISHFWAEVQSAYKKEKRIERLEFHHWGPIKETWGGFSNLYLNSTCHIIMNGRAGASYEYQDRDDGKKELIQTGTKMKAEKDLGYEPSLLIEMHRVPKEGDYKKNKSNLWDHVAVVLKDRSRQVEGKRFVNPTFADFVPVFDYLNIGGTHFGVDTAKDSTVLFKKDSDENVYERRRQIEVLKEEIQGELTSAYPGQSGDEKKIKTDLLFAAFETRSWVALDDMSPEDLHEGLKTIKQLIIAKQQTAPPEANGKKKKEV